MKHIRETFFLLIISFLLLGCVQKNPTPISKTGFYFDTVITIDIYESNDSTLLSECFSLCDEFEKTVSRTIPGSDIYKINHADGKPTVVSDVTIELLERGIYYGDLTNGTFDITIAPLSTLWDFKNNPGEVPNGEEIKEALSHVGYKTIQIKDNEVTLKDPKAAIDLGGIAKGYMADKLKAFLISKGVKSAVINLGGNVLTIGAKPDNSAFQIGIQKPFGQGNEIISSVQSIDSSVVTSGSYERYFKTDDGILYHHILNTSTGYSCDTGLLGVTILSNSSVDGDALSTACFALGIEKGAELINSIDGVDALFVKENYEILDTRTK